MKLLTVREGTYRKVENLNEPCGIRMELEVGYIIGIQYV